MAVSTLHVHLDDANCLEVTVLKGLSDQVRHLADHVIAERDSSMVSSSSCQSRSPNKPAITRRPSPMLSNPFDDLPSKVRRKAGWTYALLFAANVGAWAWAWFAFADRPALLATAFLAYSRAKRGERVLDEEMDTLLAGRGLLARIFRPMFRIVSRSWHMYPIGFLLGLGFDTATEIGLLGISATQAAQGMSFWTILVFPALFTAGMSLMDTTDSVLMTGAYGWAFVNPIRKLWYNLTITAASVVVAILIGGIEALGLIGDKLGLEGGFWGLVGDLNDNLANFGFAVVGLFVASWIVSTVIYRAKGYDHIRPKQA